MPEDSADIVHSDIRDNDPVCILSLLVSWSTCPTWLPCGYKSSSFNKVQWLSCSTCAGETLDGAWFVRCLNTEERGYLKGAGANSPPCPYQLTPPAGFSSTQGVESPLCNSPRSNSPRYQEKTPPPSDLSRSGAPESCPFLSSSAFWPTELSFSLLEAFHPSMVIYVPSNVESFSSLLSAPLRWPVNAKRGFVSGEYSLKFLCSLSLPFQLPTKSRRIV